MSNPKCVTIISGGMDSTTLAYSLHDKGYEQVLVSFDYGQKHKRELICAAITAKALGCDHIVIDLPIGKFLGSSLTSKDIQVPHGHYEEETMKQTVVPGRNAIMLSIAWGIATAKGAEAIAYGAHRGDAAQYPDCRPKFVKALVEALNLGIWGEEKRLLVPFIEISKAEILRTGLVLKVPYQNTWTCYEGEITSCGVCGSCVERLSSFDAMNAEDPLEYKDRKTWKMYVEEFKEKQARV